MKLSTVILTFYNICLITAQPNKRTAKISLEPISVHASYKPTELAIINYDPLTLDDNEFIFYETPAFSDIIGSREEDEEINSAQGIKYLRVGIYDAVSTSWITSTTITSADTFAKGYSPTFLITLDAEGAITSVSVKGHRIDAGATRDFGPKVKVRQINKGPRPYLNRPVVLKQGKVEEPVPEKSFLQKYWWILLAVMMVVISSKGDGE